MASTYTLNQGIEKPGTGEQSGTWGNTTNTNFDIIEKSGTWYSYNEQKMGQGKDSAKKYLIENSKVAKEIETKIKSLNLCY